MAILVEGSIAKVVDHSGGKIGNNLRSFPDVQSSDVLGYVSHGGTVSLISGPWSDKGRSRWWVVIVEDDPVNTHDAHDKLKVNDSGKKGFMTEFDATSKFPVNLE